MRGLVKKSGFFVLLAVMLCLLSFQSFALKTVIIVNSKDWKDVYSTMLYGYLGENLAPQFLVSEKHSTIILYSLRKDQPLELITSKKPYVANYKSIAESQGFTNVSEEVIDNINLEFADRSGVENFIIVDPSYGYNAVSVAPYAVLTKAFVLFAEKENIDEVESFLDERTVNSLLIYGHVDREVRERLQRFAPEVINNDGDRFLNNIEIVKRYKEINDAKQVIITNGEFIESEIMSGKHPVIFIGNTNVPDVVKEYIKNSNIEVGVLIGNELVRSATTIRREVGISVFVKFGRSARIPTGFINEVEGLDLFYLPKVKLNLSIESVKYNVLSNHIEVTVKNNAEIATYFTGTYTITSGDQEQVVGDLEPVFIEGNDRKVLTYTVEPMREEPITGKAFVIFGESKNSLEFILDQEFLVEKIQVVDNSDISISKVVYNKPKQQFEIYLKNIGEVTAYADTEIFDLLVLDERQTFASSKTVMIKPGSTKASIIKADLVESDLEANPTIKVRAYYGENEESLFKVITGEFELIIQGFTIVTYLPTIIIVILV
ncbi:hypothetical protein D6745_02525, partial [Candidatus Woesearchaeota archaeon]